MELGVHQALIIFGFTQSHSDHCLFFKGSGVSFLCLLVYVDDVLVAGPSLPLIVELKQFLDSTFTIKDLGEARYFLGVEIARTANGIALNQHKYILDLVSSAGLMVVVPLLLPSLLVLRCHEKMKNFSLILSHTNAL